MVKKPREFSSNLVLQSTRKTQLYISLQYLGLKKYFLNSAVFPPRIFYNWIDKYLVLHGIERKSKLGRQFVKFCNPPHIVANNVSKQFTISDHPLKCAQVWRKCIIWPKKTLAFLRNNFFGTLETIVIHDTFHLSEPIHFFTWTFSNTAQYNYRLHLRRVDKLTSIVYDPLFASRKKFRRHSGTFLGSWRM